MRRRTRALLLAALALGASVGVVTPFAAGAAPGGSMTATNGVFTGTSGDDLLVIARDADVLTHNRFAAGDPGFESASDFDSTVAGVQTKSVAAGVLSISAGEGDDEVEIVGVLPFPLFSPDFGPGADTLDLANFATAPGAGVVLAAGETVLWNTVETVIGTPFDDDFEANASLSLVGVTIRAGGGSDAIQGSPNGDVLDGGAGLSDIRGFGGSDALLVTGPPFFPGSQNVPDTLQGGAGSDSLTVRGTSGDDSFQVGFIRGGPGDGVFDGANPTRGYMLEEIESVRVEGNEGNDSFLVNPMASPVEVDGGAGDDNAVIDARGATATVGTVAGDSVFGLPSALGQVATTVRLGPPNEQVSVVNETLIATGAGPGGGPHVRAFRSDGTAVASFFAYAPAFAGGVNVALGDLDGDLNDEIVTAAAGGGGPHVRVFQSDGTATPVSFFAYDPGFLGGVNVALADMNADGTLEIVTVPAGGGGPHVKVWSASGQLLDEWMAPGFANTGVHISAPVAAHTTKGALPLPLSAAAGSDSRVRFVDVDGEATGYNFVPYPGFLGGAFVARGEFDAADHIYDNDGLVTGAGPGGAAHVKRYQRSFDGGQETFVLASEFFAYGLDFHGGVSVATCNAIDGATIVTGPGAGGGPHVRMFTETGSPLALSLFAYGPDFRGGVRVACGGAETKAY